MLKLYCTIKDLFRVLLFSNYVSNYPKNYNGRCLRILGNGISIESDSLESVEGFDYLVVNRHVLCDDYLKIKPNFYVLADPYFFCSQEGSKILKLISHKTTWDMYLFVPYGVKVKRMVDRFFSINGHVIVKTYNSNNFRGYKWLSYWLYDKKLAMPRVQNVLVAAIMLGIYMKYERIELFRVEHSWMKNLTVGDDNLVYLNNPHSYDKDIVRPKPFKEIQHAEEFPMWHVLECYMYMFKSYSIISDYINDHGLSVEIINKTPGSFIDAFKRG